MLIDVSEEQTNKQIGTSMITTSNLQKSMIGVTYQ